MLNRYFKELYRRTMAEAYGRAHSEIFLALQKPGKVLDCGASTGQKYDLLSSQLTLGKDNYYGLEWSQELVEQASSKGLNVTKADLNLPMPFEDNSFRCVFGLSVLEHLLNPCRYLNECFRILDDNGTLIILTPNISTFFTIALLIAGKMPSSGPHPDSNLLLKNEELFKVSDESLQPDTESDTPVHRHLVVFSYKVLRNYLKTIGFTNVRGYGYGLYPFPNFMQRPLEKLDPYHCHQMVFVATKQ